MAACDSGNEDNDNSDAATSDAATGGASTTGSNSSDGDATTAPATTGATTAPADDDGGDSSDGGPSDDGPDDGGSTGGDDSDGSTGGPESPGEAIYQMKCSGCHGTGAMGGELGYEIQHPVRDYATWVIRNGRPGDEFESSEMPAFSADALTDADLDLVFDFLDAFPQPTTGEGLYVDYCGNCHGADAAGGVVEVSILNESADELIGNARDGHHLDEVDRRTGYMPAYDKMTLSDEELQLIVDHVDSL